MPSHRPNVIFLNGPSSSGKSTLAHELQTQLGPPFLHFAEDSFFAMLPHDAHERVDFFTTGSQLYAGFAACAATMAEAGHFLVIDTVAWNPGSIETFVRALDEVDVLSVGVHCDVDVLEAREQARGDRSFGLARRQLPTVHAEALYDVAVDTTSDGTRIAVTAIAESWDSVIKDPAFERMRQRRRQSPSTLEA